MQFVRRDIHLRGEDLLKFVEQNKAQNTVKKTESELMFLQNGVL